jgi:hypothetical protein
MQRGGFIFLHLPFRDSFKERRIEAGVIPNVSYIRIYEQESNRTRARDNRNGGRERTSGTRRHKPEDVREFVTLCVTYFSFALASRQTQEIRQAK